VTVWLVDWQYEGTIFVLQYPDQTKLFQNMMVYVKLRIEGVSPTATAVVQLGKPCVLPRKRPPIDNVRTQGGMLT